MFTHCGDRCSQGAGPLLAWRPALSFFLWFEGEEKDWDKQQPNLDRNVHGLQTGAPLAWGREAVGEDPVLEFSSGPFIWEEVMDRGIAL